MTVAQETRPYWLAGAPGGGSDALAVRAPDGGAPLAQIALADAATLTAAIAAAESARHALAAELPETRRARLVALADALEQRSEAFAATIAGEAGKPIRYARGEVGRAVRTFRLAAEEALRIGQEEVMELSGRKGIARRVPIGVCALVTPFNFPLNLVAHKVAPALAAGCPFVLKPAEKTPLTALALGELLAAVEPPLPPGAWSVLPALPQECGPLTDDPRVKHLSFTGSERVGWMLKERAKHATVTLELGGNAAAVLCDDFDLDDALDRAAAGAFAYSGQVCISLQRLLVPDAMLAAAAAGLAARANELRRGPVDDDATDLGPMIDAAAAERVAEWIESARARGATVHCGGTRDGSFVAPTVLTGVAHDQPLWSEEVFGPVVVLEGYDDYDAALATVNDSRYGLQAAVFTHDEDRIARAFAELEVGQLIVGDSPVWRSDEMPYGGVKASGLGREGLRYACEAMTEIRLMVRR